jgi:hypothetical protein
MTIQHLAATAEAFGRSGQPVGVSIAEVALTGSAVVFGIVTMIYRKLRGLPPRFQRRADPKGGGIRGH